MEGQTEELQVATDKQLRQGQADVVGVMQRFSAIIKEKDPESPLIPKIDEVARIVASLTIEEMRSISDNEDVLDELAQEIGERDLEENDD